MDGEVESHDALRRAPVSPGHFSLSHFFTGLAEGQRHSGEVGEAPW
jgi:hypothetical protein